MHCQECPFHAYYAFDGGKHFCLDTPIRYDDTRTSPPWCPRGHVIPGIPYPTFTPGKERA